jgi:hypothetical protein
VEEPGPIVGEGYELVFEDDFLGSSLNTDIWVPPPHHGTAFNPGEVAVSNSILTITCEPPAFVEVWSLGPQSPIGNGYPRYPQAKAWEEGYFEVRCRVTNDPWTKLAMWFFSLEQENSFGLTRDCSKLNSEWDMVENGGLAGFSGPTKYADLNHMHAFHRNTSDVCGVPDRSGSLDTSPGSGLCNWHTWSGKWTGYKLQTYLDGVLQTTLTDSQFLTSWAQPMPFIMSCAALNYTQAMIDQWGIPARPAEIVTDVDFFRVWQRPRNARRSALSLPGVTGAYASTPDSSTLDITGDIDVRVEFSANDLTPASVMSIVNRAVSGDWSWQVGLRTNGVLRLTWSADGTNTLAADSAVLPFRDGERIIYRVTMDVDNGSSQRVITHYLGTSRHGSWTQLSQNVVAGVTSIHPGSRALEIGAQNNGTQEPLAGKVYWAEVRNGIDGPVVARFDATDKPPDTSPWRSEDGKVWTVNGTAKIMPGVPKPDLYRTASPLRLA